MAEFPSLAQSRVDHLFHPVGPSLLLLLYNFSAFAYFVIDHFHFFLLMIDTSVAYYHFCLNIIDPYGVACAAIRRYRVSLLRFIFRRYIDDFACAISSVCYLQYLYCCFSSYFCFLVFVVFLNLCCQWYYWLL